MSTLNFNCTCSVLFIRLELHYMNVKPFWFKWAFIAWLDMLQFLFALHHGSISMCSWLLHSCQGLLSGLHSLRVQISSNLHIVHSIASEHPAFPISILAFRQSSIRAFCIRLSVVPLAFHSGAGSVSTCILRVTPGL